MVPCPTRCTMFLAVFLGNLRMWPVSTFRYFSDEVYLLCRPRTYDITYLELQT